MNIHRMQRTYRLLAALACTAFSWLALAASWRSQTPLWLAAWAVYLLILGFWIKDNRAPKPLLLVGTLLGGLSVLTSPFLIALLWALPAIGLMLHVLRSLATRAAHSAAGASVRQLQRRMRDWTGQSQRDLQLFSRVETAFLHRLHRASGPAASLVAAAAEAGYADRSHMGREIRRVTGLSPARFEERMASDEAFWYYRLIASALQQ